MSVQPIPASSSPHVFRVASDERRKTYGVFALLRDLPSRLRRPVANGAYRPEVDGLRFFAIAIVLVGHLAERLTRFFGAARESATENWLGEVLQRPGLGVYLFFAISGFILARQAACAKMHPLSATFLRSYFGRRILRIEPPYAFLLVATYLVITATGFSPEGTRQFFTPPDSLAASLAASVFYLHDLIWGTYPKLFPPGWSLEVEVQFYVVAPLFFAAWFATKGAARIALGAIGLIGASVLSLLAPKMWGPLHVETSILRFAHFFWLGLLLASAQATIAAQLARMRAWIPDVVAWGGLAVYLVLPNAPEPQNGADLVVGLALRAVALVAVAAMFIGVFAPRSLFRRFCARPWISLIGGACYSIYLTHLQALQTMTAMAAKFWPGAGTPGLVMLAGVEIVIAIAVGLAFYALIERTFMKPSWPRAFLARLSPGGAPREAKP